MKFKKFIIPALCMAMLSAGCSGQDPVTPGNGQNGNGGTTVSYTHLTLPTSDLV